MLKLTVKNDISPALSKFSNQLSDRFITAGGTAVQLILARSLTDFMRDAKGEPKRRSPLDGGPLRIVSGRLARSLTGARTGTNAPESIYRVISTADNVAITFGSAVPYAAIHEYSGMAGRNRGTFIPGRPYLSPALLIEENDVIQLFDREVQALANEVGL
ncbi:hypothetical protein OAF54_02745 [bacterium]|nr:hypothetical protein [bacterium]